MLELNRVYCGDCMEVMRDIESGSIDMILCDLPYGSTACKWDTIIPFEPLWEAYKRIIKKNGAIVLTASQPFTSMLVMSNIKWFKYEWIWRKSIAANFMNAKLKPLQKHENVLVFSEGNTSNGNGNNMLYNPQELKKTDRKWQRPKKYPSEHNFVRPSHSLSRIIEYSNYPDTILEYSNGNNGTEHPTQKPVSLFSYLIRTYTNEGDTVLDNCAGSGTTAVSCINTNRNFIFIEQEAAYCAIAERRIKEAQAQCKLELV